MSQEMLTSLIPLALILLVVVARVLFARGGASGGSFAGMAVCRSCGRAFPRPLLAPNLITGKLVRCPNCRAIAILPAASRAELEVARALESESTEAQPAGSQDDALRRRIEQSKYE